MKTSHFWLMLGSVFAFLAMFWIVFSVFTAAIQQKNATFLFNLLSAVAGTLMTLCFLTYLHLSRKGR